MPNQHKVLTARDIMSTTPVTISPDTPIFEAINLLLKNDVTGAPVIDENSNLVGVISEYDCLRVLGPAEFYDDKHLSGQKVKDYMSGEVKSAPPDLGIYMLAKHLLDHSIQRLPIVEDGKFLGLVTRAHVLRGIERMRKARAPRKIFPDFRLPLRNLNGHVD